MYTFHMSLDKFSNIEIRWGGFHSGSVLSAMQAVKHKITHQIGHILGDVIEDDDFIDICGLTSSDGVYVYLIEHDDDSVKAHRVGDQFNQQAWDDLSYDLYKGSYPYTNECEFSNYPSYFTTSADHIKIKRCFMLTWAEYVRYYNRMNEVFSIEDPDVYLENMFTYDFINEYLSAKIANQVITLKLGG